MRRFIIIGLAAVCALALSALGASGAAAAETTVFTCLSGGTEFSNGDCNSTVGTKSFHHEAIPVNTPTQLTLKTIAGEATQTLSATVAEVLIEVVGTGVSCMECMIENKGVVGSMEVTGAGGTLVYTGMTLPGNAGCEFKGTETGVVKTGVLETKPLKFVNGATNEFLIEPVTPPVFAEFTIVAKPGQNCPLANTYKITGDINGVAAGANLTVNVGKTGTLKLGVNKASLVGKATMEAGITGGTPAEHHATVLT